MPALNDSPLLIRALADLVLRAVGRRSGVASAFALGTCCHPCSICVHLWLDMRFRRASAPWYKCFMEFSLTDEQQHLRRTVREFAEGEIAPHVMEWDEASHFPSEIIPKLAEMGFLGVIFPEQYGGAGMGYVEYAIIIEELSRVDGSIGIIVAAHNSLCTNHIFKFGTEAQRQKYVTPLAQGKKLGCWSLTEPEAGSDAGGTRTVARSKTTAG